MANSVNSGNSHTNLRGETPIEAFRTACVEAFAPMLRDAIYGRKVPEGEAQSRLEYQLENRGFTITSDTRCDEE